MPKKGHVDELRARNVINGEAWSALGPDEKAVFEAPLVLALVGLPDYTVDFDNEDNGKGPKTHVLNEAEEARYRPIWEQLVDVARVQEKEAEGFDEADHHRKAMHSVHDIHHQVSFYIFPSDSSNFDFLLLFLFKLHSTC